MSSPPNLHTTVGAIELGALVTSVLYGIILIQGFTYFTTKSSAKDNPWLKLLVALICVAETVHTSFIWHSIYHFTIVFSQLEVSPGPPWSLASAVSNGAAIACTVQAFYAYRSYRLTQRWLACAVILPLAAVRLGFAISISVVSYRTGSYPIFLTKYKWLVLTAMIAGVFVDILNTLNLSYFFWSVETHFSETRKSMDKLVTWTIETGLATTSIIVLGMITLLAMPNNLVWMAFVEFGFKLNTCALLATLNGRSALRTSDMSTPVQFASVGRISGGAVEMNHHGTREQIRVSKQQVVHVDGDFSRHLGNGSITKLSI